MQKPLTLFLAAFLTVTISACSLKNSHQVNWTKIQEKNVPSEVVHFFAGPTGSKIITVIESKHIAGDTLYDESTSNSFFTVKIDGTKISIRKKEFKGPLLIFKDTLYYNRSFLQKDKTVEPGDLDVFATPVKTVL
ncbi:MAG: hypothetical protein JWQ30_922 [Sediminibacterium sp.]|nr:hypothetical protein [Sediminibacterium sp.]